MNNNLSKKKDLKLHLVDIPTPEVGPLRGKQRPAVPSNPFGISFKAYFEQSAMSQQEYAEVLAVELDRDVSQVNVSNWLHGVEPRNRSDSDNLADEILKAAERIAQTETHAKRQKYVDAKKVKDQFAKWRAGGLTSKQIQLAGELSASRYRAWSAGTAPILAARWELARVKVEMWKDFIAEHQRTWQTKTAATAGLEKKATAKKSAPTRGAPKG